MSDVMHEVGALRWGTTKKNDASVKPLTVPEETGFCNRAADFGTLAEALDHAALASTGMKFYNARGKLEHELSYASLRERSWRLATSLMAEGLSRGDRIGIVADMEPDFICAFFACQYAGLVAVPLPVITGLGGRDGYEKQLTNVLGSSHVRVALGPASFSESLSNAAKEKAVELVSTVAELMDRPLADVMLKPLRSDEISHIQFSSGSTRYPLGVEISQGAVMANARSIAVDALGLNSQDRIASWLPFYHDMGLIGCMIVPLTCQLSIDYLHTDSFARRPVQWLRMISDNRCTVSFSPKFGYDLCTRRLASKVVEDLDLSCWRVAGIGGDMIQAEVMDRFSELFAPHGFRPTAFVPSYGLAEATLAVSFQPLDDGICVDVIDKSMMMNKSRAVSVENMSKTAVRSVVSCGKPMTGYTIEIRNENGEVLPDRQIGDVYIKGPSLMDGYHNDEEATAACLTDDGWLDTGDMGYLADGFIYITGRRKDMIIINGRNIWPQDLEWYAEHSVPVLRNRDAAAFSNTDESGREEAVLLVQCRLADTEAREELSKVIHAAVYRNTGVDCRVELIPPRKLPFTTSGKLSRVRAKKAWLAGEYLLSSRQTKEALAL